MLRNICLVTVSLISILTAAVCHAEKTKAAQHPFAAYEVNKIDAARLLHRPGIMLAERIYFFGGILIIEWEIAEKNSSPDNLADIKVKTEYEAVNLPIRGYGLLKQRTKTGVDSADYDDYSGPEHVKYDTEETDQFAELGVMVQDALKSGNVSDLNSAADELISRYWWDLAPDIALNEPKYNPVEEGIHTLLYKLTDHDSSVYDIYERIILFEIQEPKVKNLMAEVFSFNDFLRSQADPQLTESAIQTFKAALDRTDPGKKHDDIQCLITELSAMTYE